MIKTVLFKNGLEVVADVEEFDTEVRLIRPLKIHMASIPMQGPKGIHLNNQATLVPLCATCVEDRYSFPPSDIALMLTTKAEVAADYIRRTTGLELAPAGSF